MEQMPNRIRELRNAKGWHLETLADKVGCSVTQLSDLERGNRPLTLHWMQRVARQLKVQPGDLLNEKENSRSLAADQRELVDCYDAADDKQKAQILTMARMLAGVDAQPRRKRAANE